MIKYALGILVVALLCQAGAWAAVQVSWTDAVGSHTEDLALAWNPEYTGAPNTLENRYAWLGTLNVVMNDYSTIVFTCTGNFIGGEGLDEGIWKQVRLRQYVLNETSRPWVEFNLGLADLTPDPNLSNQATFYNVVEWSPESWSPLLTEFYENYCPDDPEVGPFVPVHGTFYDIAKIASDCDSVTGDGGFVLSKWATPGVPEPGSLVAISGLMAGLIAFAQRRKA